MPFMTHTKNLYDAIVVGARCAGAPTAMLLARQGHRVLLVDRSTFPSDTLSTLVIQPHGVAALRRWALLDQVVATGCPPIERSTFDFGPVVISGRPRPVDANATAFAPRRTVLDKILVARGPRSVKRSPSTRCWSRRESWLAFGATTTARPT